jgi:hypothetical protein
MKRHNGDQSYSLDQFNPWGASAGPLMQTSVKLTEAACNQAFKVAAELTDFTLLRVQEDVRLPERLARCRSPQDVQQAWMDFWSKAFQQYQNEWTKLAEINRAALAGAGASHERQTERRMHAAA